MKRQDIISLLARETPLSFVAGTSALKAWNEDPEGKIRITSKTGRRLSLYAGPARRYFGDPKDPLERGRGRVALVLRRNLLLSNPGTNWDFAPFDVGEVLYHWVHGSLPEAFIDQFSMSELKNNLRPIAELERLLALILDECYEDPWDYFRVGRKPRPSVEVDPLVNAVYRAATERWFGRVRSFSGSTTFEVRADRDIVLDSSDILGIFIVSDQVIKETPIERFLEQFETVIHPIPCPQRILHPDLASNLLESETTRFILAYLESALGAARSDNKENANGIPQQYTYRRTDPPSSS